MYSLKCFLSKGHVYLSLKNRLVKIRQHPISIFTSEPIGVCLVLRQVFLVFP